MEQCSKHSMTFRLEVTVEKEAGASDVVVPH